MANVVAKQVKQQQAGTSPFDQIRRIREDGSEYWSARELLMGTPGMGYGKWQDAEKVIRRAKNSCVSFGTEVQDHFTQVRKKATQQGVTSRGQSPKDYELSRYACYLVAMNCDPSKPEVGAAQSYFATQTRRAEVGLIRDEKWQTARLEGKTVRGQFTDVLQQHGVENGGYGLCTDAINREVLGAPAREFRRRLELKKSDATRDHCTSRQLVQLTLSEDIASHRIERDNVRGNQPCATTSGRAAADVVASIEALYLR